MLTKKTSRTSHRNEALYDEYGSMILSQNEYFTKTFTSNDEEIEYTIKAYISKNPNRNSGIVKDLNETTSQNSVGQNQYVKIVNKSKTIGMVCYMETGYSTTPKENLKIHIPEAPHIYPKIIEQLLNTVLEIKPTQIIVGHEHGDLKKKCHLQICIRFSEEIQKIINPGRLDIFEGDTKLVSLLYMQQKGYNSNALANYCLKEGDVEYLNNYGVLNKIYDEKGKLLTLKTIAVNRSLMTKSEAFEFLLVNDPRLVFASYCNVMKTLEKVITPVLPEFHWVIPKHLDNYMITDETGAQIKFMPVFMKWFDANCIKNPDRKQALCLYSESRGVGKSCFARSLVNDIGYLLEYNNTFTERNLNVQYKLLLLDDMQDISNDNSQMWRSLVASQPTSIRAAYVNDRFELSIPCIITTNSEKMLTGFLRDPLFNKQVLSIEINEYMGPLGTRPEFLESTRSFISRRTMDKCLSVEKRNEENKKNDSKIAKMLFKTFTAANK